MKQQQPQDTERFLALETSGKDFSLALSCGTSRTRSLFLGGAMMHSAHLVRTLDGFLRDAQITLRELTGIAVCVGPGSFTGIRVGVSAARIIAQQCGIPGIGVNALDCLAGDFKLQAGVVVPLVPAIQGEVYWSMYRHSSHGMKKVADDGVSRLQPFAEQLLRMTRPQDPLVLCGSAVAMYTHELTTAFASRRRSVILCPRVMRADAVLQWALAERAAGRKRFSWRNLTPQYVQLPQAVLRKNAR